MLQERDAGTSAYRVQCVLRLDGGLRPQLLEAAVSSVIERHEILRTCFHLQAGMFLPLQVIADHGSTLRRLDLAGLPAQEQQTRIDEWLDQSNGASLDVTLATVSAGEHVLLISLPALCADRESLRQIVREIKRAYANEALLDDPTQYKVVSQWFNDVLEAEEAQIGKDYWREQWSDQTSTIKLPFERDASETFTYQSITAVLSPSVIAKLDRLLEQLKISQRAFFLTCWQTLIYRLTGETSVTTGTYFDGRSDAALTEALGLFARYLPVQNKIVEDSRFSELLTKIDQAVHLGYDWQECFTASSETYFPFCFDYDEQSTRYQSGDVTFSILRQRACIDRFKLELVCSRRGDSVIAEFNFDLAIFDPADIERLAENFQTLLASAVDNPEATIGELNILGITERQKLLIELNDTSREYARESCLHQLFEQQAALTPHNVAVVFRDEQLTFTELNARANQLARHLQTLGVSTESLVAICMERSVEMVVALLATLKAGAAYVPLDPESPIERQACILRETHPAVIFTQEDMRANLPACEAMVITDVENLTQYSDQNLH